MKSKLLIRFADPETEYPRVAHLISLAVCRTVTADDLRIEEELKTPGTVWHWWVAIRNNVIVAAAQVVHFGSQPVGHYRVNLAVDPAWRGQGIGQVFWLQVHDYLLGQGAARLICDLNDRHEAGLRFAQRQDFVLERQHIGSALALDGFNYERFAEVETAVLASGIRIHPFSHFGNSPESQRQLYEVNRIAEIDNPGVLDPTFPSFERWRGIVLDALWFDPDGQFVAVDGDTFVGLSSVFHKEGDEEADTKLTGVLRAYRGRKIALALKLAVIRYAQTRGAKRLVTSNDSNNVPMLAINRKLGFVPEKGQGFYTLVQRLG